MMNLVYSKLLNISRCGFDAFRWHCCINQVCSLLAGVTTLM